MVRTLHVNNVEVEFTFDTGADVSTLTEKTCDMLCIKLQEPDRCLSGADGSMLNVLGVSNVNIKGTYGAVNAPVYVLKGSSRNLLGRQELKQLNLLAVINAMYVNECDPLKEFPNVRCVVAGATSETIAATTARKCEMGDQAKDPDGRAEKVPNGGDGRRNDGASGNGKGGKDGRDDGSISGCESNFVSNGTGRSRKVVYECSGCSFATV
jgi:hypothetical protein